MVATGPLTGIAKWDVVKRMEGSDGTLGWTRPFASHLNSYISNIVVAQLKLLVTRSSIICPSRQKASTLEGRLLLYRSQINAYSIAVSSLMWLGGLFFLY